MSDPGQNRTNDVSELLRNAQLRDELEPYFDESIARLNLGARPTAVENEYLESMLAWERAPVLPVARWFDPPLCPPGPESLSDEQLSLELWKAIYALYSQRIVLEFADHLTDRQLYCIIVRDILPSYEKKLSGSTRHLHWSCIDAASDPETWLKHYATDEERAGWAEQGGGELPEREEPAFVRELPRPAAEDDQDAEWTE